MRTFIAFAFLLFSWCAHGATVVTKTIQESGGDYTSIAAWEAGRQADLVAADSIEMGVIQGSWSAADSTAVLINGWTTDATRYVVLTNSTSKHDGKRYGSAANAHKLEVTAANGLNINEDFVRIYGLQIKVIETAGSEKYCVTFGSLNNPSDVRIGNCILASGATGSGVAYGVVLQSANATVSFWNTLIYGFSLNSSMGVYHNQGSLSFYSCTAAANSTDFYRVAGTSVAYNCISQDSTSDGFTGGWSGDWNCSDRASDAPGANSVNTYDVTFVSETGGSEDYHITSANTSIIDVTSDQSGGLFSDDIDGVTRAGAWDIGADEYEEPPAEGGGDPGVQVSNQVVGVDLPLEAQGFTLTTNYMLEGGWYKRMWIGTNTMTANVGLTNGAGTYKVFSRIYSPNATYTNSLTIGSATFNVVPSGIDWVSTVFTTTNAFTNIAILFRKGILTNVHDWVVGGFYLEPITNYANVNNGGVVDTTHFFANFTVPTTTNLTDIVGGNMFPNSSFENGVAADWGMLRDTFNTNSITWQEEAIDSTQSVTGNNAFRIAQDRGNFRLISPPVRARGTNVYRPYTLTASAKLVGSGTPNPTITVLTTVPGVAGAYTNSQTMSMGTVTATWQRFTNRFYFAPVPTREFYVTWDHSLTGTNGIVLDDIMLEEGTNASTWTPSTPVEVAIKTGRNGNLFLAGDPVVLQLTAYNAHATNRTISVATDVYNYDNSIASNMVTTLTVPPGGSTNWIYPPSEVGPYRVQTRLLGEQDFRNTETSYAVAAFGPNSTATLPASNMWFGTHMPSTKQATMSNRVWGLDITRAFSSANMFRWSTIQPSSNTWSWNYADVAVSNTAPHVTIYGSFNDIKGTPSWAMTSNVPIMSSLQLFVSNVVARYKDRIGWWETMNEPYAYAPTLPTNASEQMTAAIVLGARSADPNARISAGVMDRTNNWLDLYNALSVTVRTQIQDVAYHYYPYAVGTAGANMNSDESYAPVKTSAELARAQGYRPVNSESGIWEYGNSHANGNWFTDGHYVWPFQQEAAYVRGHHFTTMQVLRQALRCAGNGMVFLHYYSGLLGITPTRPDTTPTLFNNNDSLKNQGLAYYTAANFVGKGTPTGPLTNTAAGVNIEAYGFQGNDGGAWVTAWALRPSTNWTVTITNTAFEARNVFGKSIQSNVAAVTVGMLPVYIHSTTMGTNTLNAEFIKAAVAGAGTLPAPQVSIDYSPEGLLTKAPYWFKWTSASGSRINYFTMPYQVLTRFKIDGITTNWSDWGSDRQYVIDTLPAAGIYRLEVQTKDAIGASTNTTYGPTFFVNDGNNVRVDTLRTP